MTEKEAQEIYADMTAEDRKFITMVMNNHNISLSEAFNMKYKTIFPNQIESLKDMMEEDPQHMVAKELIKVLHSTRTDD